jgi:DNA replication licensing factor MCM5
MEGFDNAGIFFSDNFGEENHDENAINLQAVKNKFKEFLKKFNEDNFHYKYR